MDRNQMKYGDKSKKVRILKTKYPEWGYRKIARAAGCSISVVHDALTRTPRYNPDAWIEPKHPVVPKYVEPKHPQPEHHKSPSDLHATYFNPKPVIKIIKRAKTNNIIELENLLYSKGFNIPIIVIEELRKNEI